MIRSLVPRQPQLVAEPRVAVRLHLGDLQPRDVGEHRRRRRRDLDLGPGQRLSAAGHVVRVDGVGLQRDAAEQLAALTRQDLEPDRPGRDGVQGELQLGPAAARRQQQAVQVRTFERDVLARDDLDVDRGVRSHRQNRPRRRGAVGGNQGGPRDANPQRRRDAHRRVLGQLRDERRLDRLRDRPGRDLGPGSGRRFGGRGLSGSAPVVGGGSANESSGGGSATSAVVRADVGGGSADVGGGSTIGGGGVSDGPREGPRDPPFVLSLSVSGTGAACSWPSRWSTRRTNHASRASATTGWEK